MSDEAIIDVPIGFNGTERITYADVKAGDELLDVFGGFKTVKRVRVLKTGIKVTFDGYGPWSIEYALPTDPCNRRTN
jgi:hypothetical protein